MASYPYTIFFPVQIKTGTFSLTVFTCYNNGYIKSYSNIVLKHVGTLYYEHVFGHWISYNEAVYIADPELSQPLEAGSLTPYINQLYEDDVITGFPDTGPVSYRIRKDLETNQEYWGSNLLMRNDVRMGINLIDIPNPTVNVIFNINEGLNNLYYGGHFYNVHDGALSNGNRPIDEDPDPDPDPDPDLYTLTVTNGTGSGDYEEGSTINISHSTPPAGQKFDQWTGDISILNDPFAPGAVVTMPAWDAGIIAYFVDIPPPPAEYHLTVNNGTGTGDYLEGATVSIEADSADTGYAFDYWSGDTSHLADSQSASTTVTMPAEAISVSANYYLLPILYTLTVTNGTGSGDYEEGETITVTADPPIEGFEFFMWIGDLWLLDSNFEPEFTIQMPAQDISFTAGYSDLTTYPVCLLRTEDEDVLLDDEPLTQATAYKLQYPYADNKFFMFWP